MGIKENLEAVLGSIAKCGQVSLVVVTKKATIAQTIEAIESGATIIGENRVHEAARKFPHLPPVEKHMIGHLQTNKVKIAVRLFDCIQTVDSLKLANEIDKRTEKLMPVMIQVSNGEAHKFGIEYSEAAGFYDKLKKLENLKVVGLMAMAPFVEPELTRPFFRKMKKLQDELGLEQLSLGMTNDYEIAIEEGSTMVRIGTRIFS